MARRPARKKQAARKQAAVVPPGVAPGRSGGTGGQVAFRPTDVQREIVRALVSIGTANAIIATTLSVPERTLVRHFAEELKTGRAIIHAKIGGAIVAGALAGDKTMMIFYAKAQMGWRERTSVGFEDERGGQVSAKELFTISIQG